MYYYAPTGGYANTASTWKDSVGAPVQIQVPYAARAMNQACLTTGGHPPLTGALQAGGGRRRKGRKGTRKVRRGGALQLPFGLSLPTSRENFAGIGQTITSRIPGLGGIGSFFGFGGPANAAAVAEAPVETANTTVVEEQTLVSEPSPNGNGNANRGNANRNRMNGRNNRRNNMLSNIPSTPGSMNGTLTPPPTPEPMEAMPEPLLTPPPPLAPMVNSETGVNGAAPPPPPVVPAAVNPTASSEGNSSSSSLSPSYGGRGRSKSRRSRRSALKKKKF
jgi:hypothetical protein